MTQEELEALWEQSSPVQADAQASSPTEPTSTEPTQEELAVLFEQSTPIIEEGQILEEGQPVPEGFETYHDPMQGTVLRKIAPERTIGEQLVGAGETALSLGTAATGGTVGYIGGILSGLADALESGKYGTKEGAQMVKQAAEELSAKLTFTPRSEAGQEYTQAVSEALAPLEALTPMAAEFGAAGQAIRPKVSQAIPKITKPIKEEFDLLRSAIPESEKVKQIRTAIKENPTSKEVALYKIEKGPSGFERVIADTDAKEAINQGFDQAVISTVKAGSDADKKKMTQMMNIHKLGSKSATYRAKNRPTDIVGKSVEDRISYLNKEKKNAGNEIENFANELKGKKVDYEPAVNNFIKDLDDIGVKVSRDEKGDLKIDLRGSDIEGDMASKKLLNTIFNRLVNTDVPDGYGVHRAKRFIDTQVSYGKTKANPLSRATENIVKSLRRNLNESLGEFSESYRNANTKYSEITNILDDVQKAVGPSVNFDSPNISKSLGTASRGLLSNVKSRGNLIDAFSNLDEVSKKYGMNITDDITKQVIFAEEIDRMFGAAAPTSLKGQVAGAVEKGIDVAAGRGTIYEDVKGLAKTFREKAKGINEENAIKSIEKVLKSQKGE